MRLKKAQLVSDTVADSENSVAVSCRFDKRVFEKIALVAEDIFEIEIIFTAVADEIVKHCVVSGMLFDEIADCRCFVSVEDGFEAALRLEDCGKSGWHTHKFVCDDCCVIVGGANSF
ncbi:hypothetical protein ES703_102946 [subsurface metagenome]